MTAVLYTLPFNDQIIPKKSSKAKVSKPVEGSASLTIVPDTVGKEVNIEELNEGGLRLKFSIAVSRTLTKWHQALDEEDRLAVLQASHLPKVAREFGVVTSIEEFKQFKEMEKQRAIENIRLMAVFSKIDEVRRVKGTAGLIKYLQAGRAQGGDYNPDYQMARDYKVLRKSLSEELKELGVRGIEIV